MEDNFECLRLLGTAHIYSTNKQFSSTFNDRNFLCSKDNLNANLNCGILFLNNFPLCKFFFKGIKIVVQPDSQAVLSGQVVKLCCWATGHPFVHYQWFKQEKEVVDDTEYRCFKC